MKKNESMVKPLILNTIKSRIEQYNQISETTGILSLESITKTVTTILSNYDVQFCYRFGSYAKGKPTPISDVDLFIDGTNIHGLDYFGLIEDLRETLHKKVDPIHFDDFSASPSLQMKMLKDGIRIYRKSDLSMHR